MKQGKRKEHGKRTDRQTETGGRKLLRGACTGALIALGAGIVLLLIFCGICLSLRDPARFAPVFAYAAALLASLTAGIVSAHTAGERGILSGILGGVLFCACLWALSLCLPGEDLRAPVSLSLGVTSGCLLFSAVGGYSVTHRKPKKRKH